MNGRHWALIVSVAMMVGACGTPGATAASTPKPKPSAAARVAAIPPAWVMPFEDVWFLNPNEGWAVILSGPDHAIEIVHSLDRGATWSTPARVTSLFVPEGSAPPHVGIRFTSALIGWVFGPGIFATVDGGLTWTDTLGGRSVSDLATFGDSAWAIAGCDPRVASPCPTTLLVWDASARNWHAAPYQPPATSGPLNLIRTSATRAFVVQTPEMDTRLMRTDDGGLTWTTLSVPCRGFGMPLATLDGVHVWLVCPSQPGAGSQVKEVYISGDGGSTWSLHASTDPPGTVGTITISGYAQQLALSSATTGFLVMDRGDLYRSTDSGTTWVATGISHEEGFFPALDFVDATHGWAAAQVSTIDMAGRVGLYRTVDAGASWMLASSMAGTV
jgi:photosystem II stability/assembly factor-like uncharacterized protein